MNCRSRINFSGARYLIVDISWSEHGRLVRTSTFLYVLYFFCRIPLELDSWTSCFVRRIYLQSPLQLRILVVSLGVRKETWIICLWKKHSCAKRLPPLQQLARPFLTWAGSPDSGLADPANPQIFPSACWKGAIWNCAGSCRTPLGPLTSVSAQQRAA